MELSQRDRRLVIVLGIAAVVLVVVLAFTLLGGGGGQPTAIGPAPGGGVLPTTPPSASPTPTPTPSAARQFAGRDPFSVPAVLCTLGAPSATAPAPSTAAAPSPATSGSPAPGSIGSSTNPCAGTTGSVPGSGPTTSAPPPAGGGGGNNNGGTTGGGTTGGTTGGGTNNGGTTGGGANGGGGNNGGSPSSTTQGSDNVSLLDVFTRNGKKLAQVRVNAQVYTVEEGEHFHQNYELVSISGNCAGFVYGDSPFTLCTTARK